MNWTLAVSWLIWVPAFWGTHPEVSGPQWLMCGKQSASCLSDFNKAMALLRKQDPHREMEGEVCLWDGMTVPSPSSHELHFQPTPTLTKFCTATLWGATLGQFTHGRGYIRDTHQTINMTGPMFAFWRMDLISAALQQKSLAMPTLFKVQAL